MLEENNIINFSWNGSDISFKLSGNGTMVNATEMAKAFPGKFIADWNRLKSTKEFLNTLSSIMGIPTSQLIISRKGNTSLYDQGTWMHEDVAIEFARWLNPVFAVWCNKKIKEILINGYSVLGNSREAFERAYQDIQDKLSQVEQENYQLKQSLDTQKAAESFCNAVFQKSENLYTMTDIVKGLNFNVGRVDMYNKLEELGFMFKRGNTWRLKDPWSKQGFTKDILVQGKDGKYHNVIRWTEPGRAFVYTIALRCGYVSSDLLG